MKNIIVAYDQNHVIGYQNALPWQGQMPADMQYFRRMTTGKAIIMGHRTYESIGQPLPNRLNIVLSHQPIELPGVIVASNLEEAYHAASHYEEVFVIGGTQVYQSALPSVERIYATELGVAIENADAYFPTLNPHEWRQISREDHPADDVNFFPYSFVTYQRY